MKLNLKFPVYPYFVGQQFGNTTMNSYYQANGVNFLGHNGLDLAAMHGQPVYASHDGVCSIEVDSKQGHGVVLTTNNTFDYKGGQAFFKTIYWHLIDNIPVTNGQQVKCGDIIGYADNTGLSTGDHLHFGLKPMSSTMQNIENDNGYYGAIDPAPYFDGTYAHADNRYMFTKSMELGQTSEDIKQLQILLQKRGYFPQSQECTGYYGNITRQSVFTFQQERMALTLLERLVYKGRYVGPKTLKVLNLM